MQLKSLVLIFIVLFASVPLLAQNRTSEPVPPMPKLLSQLQQMEVREKWLEKRLGSLLLPMMKRHGIEMWIVVNEEFKSDPVTEHIVPPIPMVGSRDIFVFVDQGERIDRIAMVRYEEERLKDHYRMVMPARDKFGEELKKIVDARNPRSIALNIGGTAGSKAVSLMTRSDFLPRPWALKTKRSLFPPPLSLLSFSTRGCLKNLSITVTQSLLLMSLRGGLFRTRLSLPEKPPLAMSDGG